MSAAAITQLLSVSIPRDGQFRFGQRCIASPSGLTMFAPQSGHFFGMRSCCVPGWCGPAAPPRSVGRVALDAGPVDLLVEPGAAPLPLGAGLHHVLDRIEALGVRVRPDAVVA